MKAGSLDRRITIQQTTETRDAAGGVTNAWGTFRECWGNRRDTTGHERIISQAETAVADCVWRIRWAEGLTAKMRVLEGADAWDIVAVAEIARREGLDLACTRVRP